MLKPKSLIFALTLVPFLLVSMQLTSEAGKRQAGATSGKTPAGGSSGLPSTTTTPRSQTVTVPNAQSIIVSTQQGSVVLSLSPQVQAALNQLAPGILGALGGSANAAALSALLTGGAGAQQAAATILAALTSAGVDPQLAAALVDALNGLFSPSTAYSPGSPMIQAQTGAMLVANKDLKNNTTVAQSGAALSVNVSKLSAAINAYNSIVVESKPPVLKRLSQDANFVGIGSTLKQLRKAIP